MAKQKKNKQTQISISLPKELLKQIDEMAQIENRSRSNFISNVFTQMAKEKLEASGDELPDTTLTKYFKNLNGKL